MGDVNYSELLQAWGLEFGGLDDSALIEGSPERTTARSVVFDSNGRRWILEKIAKGNLDRKQEIAGRLQDLSDAGFVQVQPYKRTNEGSFFSQQWMLRSFVDGIPLARETYLKDSWRIDALARFLIELREHAVVGQSGFFSIAAYAEGRMSAWRTKSPALAAKLEPSFRILHRRFFGKHDSLPRAFCHGDYHPLNMVWGESSIRSVIDWEFCGSKPELYDVALLLGCFGFEEPDHLLQAPAIRLIEKLRAADFAEPVSWEYLLDLMATIRFGWMSEWIRRGDIEAQEMELMYIGILVDQKAFIQQAWLSRVSC